MRIRVSPRATANARPRSKTSVKRASILANSAQRIKTGKGSMLSALSANNTVSSKLARSNYQKLEKSATGLTERLSYLSRKVAEGGKDISTGAKELVDYYNDILENLKENSSVLNQFYYQSLRETVAGNKKELEEVGISVSANGSLSLNKDKLAAADADKLKKVFGADSDFVKRTSVVAERVADNAKTNAQSYSNQYNAAGGLENSYLSRYNFKG